MSQTTGTGAKKILDTDDWRDILDLHNDTVDAYDGKIGTTALPTTAQTLTGAISEHNAAISDLLNVPATTYNGDLNTLLTNGYYILGSSATNAPPTMSSGKLKVEDGGTSNYKRQTYYCGYEPKIYTRTRYYLNGSWLWTSWQEVVLNVVSTFTITSNTTYIDANSLFGRKIGNVVTINGFLKLKSAAFTTGAVQVATIPQGSRPSSPIRIPCAFAEQAYMPPTSFGYLTIDGDDGALRIYAASGESTSHNAVYFSCSYMAEK